VQSLKEELRESRWGTWLVQEGEAMADRVRPETRPATTQAGDPAGFDQDATESQVGVPSGNNGGGSSVDLAGFFRRAAGWASSAVLAVVVLLFVLFTGLYLAIDPGLYMRGVLWLVPPRGRRKADCVLKRVGHTLRYWIMGQLVAMALVGTVAGLGLWILGAPLPMVLGTLAGVAEFVPNVGPFVAAGLPTLLSATAEGRFLSGPSLAVAVLLMFIAIQTLESYVITPMIQQRAVEMPPALLITTQLAAAMLLGPIGVVIAAPLVASVMAALNELVVVGDPANEHPKDRSHEE
jgi:predicted PurR-regulated permease PerM